MRPPDGPAAREFRKPSMGDRSYSGGGAPNNLTPRDRERAPTRGGGGSGTRQIEDVLQYIQSEWSFMAQDKCVPVQVALQLMDSSSLGRANQYSEFQATHKQLQRALKAIVNEHHQGFNSSIGTFHKIQSSIQSSQTRLRQLRESLVQAKSGLSTTRPELKGLASTSQGYDEMLQCLAQIEHLRLVTDKLEARISEKRFLTAVDVLQDALRLLRKPEMDNIGALSDLRSYLANQETSLTDILIEELHSHLYLKSPYCQDRWKAHVREISNGASSEGRDASVPELPPLYHFLDELDTDKPMVEDATRNPEADSFYYIQLLVESLNKMDRLDVAVNAIEQRLPVELFRVVDKTNNEVDRRHPNVSRGTGNSQKNRVDLGIENDDVRSVVLSDLLWTLYAKFESIAEGHRVFHDVVVGIAKRENIREPESLTGSFRELWMLYQNEIRSLLHDYLATDTNIYRMSQSISQDADVFKRGQRNKGKKIFSLSDIDPKSTIMNTEFDDLESILKTSVPGLVSVSKRPTGTIADDKAPKTDGAATGHKLLIDPSVFNMGALLPPSLAFIQRLKDIVPPGPEMKTKPLTAFLDDFLVNVFLPQLDETLVKFSSQTFEEADAFQEDPKWAEVARRPILKGCSAFFDLITAFCRMLDTIPHDQAFSQLIITQMVGYYDRCCDWYQALVSRTQDSESYGPSLKASAAIAMGPGEIHDTVKKLWTDGEENRSLLDKESGLLILQTNENPLTDSDIILDRKIVTSLCLLYTSMRWLASKINQLRNITHHDADSSRRTTMRASQSRRWTLLQAPGGGGDNKGSVYLPMTQETVVAFDSIVSSYQDLAGTVLLTLHVESRCQIVHTLALALSPSNAPYLLEQVVSDPDPRILALNAELVAYDETTSHYLHDKEITFLRNGLALLIDNYLVTNAGMVKPMNANGCGRMQLNILVLQQNLKNIEPDSNLTRSADYYDLFMDGHAAVLEKAKEPKGKDGNPEFTYDELKTLIELCFSEQIADPERGVSTVAKRNMGDLLLQLSEFMWQS
ncbi:hypothetical protein V492_01725 [Pseudogymnoascus sp. VKM F-4246]|nr:hypothetical protein V492_01725 [Pseudogymnoascus sp. VKM F-4246]